MNAVKMPRNLVRLYSYGTSGRTCSLGYHPCVAPKADGREQIFASSESPETNLDQYIKEMTVGGACPSMKHPSVDFVRPLFVQLAYAVKHIHDAGRSIIEKLDEDTGRLFTFSQDRNHVILRNFTSTSTSLFKTNQVNDVKSLGDLFCFVLCGTSKVPSESLSDCIKKKVESLESETAVDLIKKMRERSTNFTIDDVLKHPYFWSPMKKINFLCSVWQLYVSEMKMRKSSEDRIGNKYKDWKNNLRVRTLEDDDSIDTKRTAIERLLKHSPGEYSAQIPPGFELLHFFRNCYAHYWSNDMGHNQKQEAEADLSRTKQGKIRLILVNARGVFKSEHEGFWSFWTERFPDFFISVYCFAKGNRYMREKLVETGYFSELAPFCNLVQKKPDGKDSRRALSGRH